ncbi:hypothetical protein GCM10010277_85660 [Streptomyces longisporoflavus]|uniref:hypothetical protein n=1 Tax=Streptomyces longisporoflavus TaxID=28044 RepID=UPI00167C705F|nr:hypothetical protein [Streptomyces longisporoflavus]GGV72594.1 hypothetical protein GCM10010277_85660 [Streptomyces longisporoflavus]
MHIRTIFATAMLATVTVIGGASTASADDGPAVAADALQNPIKVPGQLACNAVEVSGTFDPSHGSDC